MRTILEGRRISRVRYIPGLEYGSGTLEIVFAREREDVQVIYSAVFCRKVEWDKAIKEAWSEAVEGLVTVNLSGMTWRVERLSFTNVGRTEGGLPDGITLEMRVKMLPMSHEVCVVESPIFVTFIWKDERLTLTQETQD